MRTHFLPQTLLSRLVTDHGWVGTGGKQNVWKYYPRIRGYATRTCHRLRTEEIGCGSSWMDLRYSIPTDDCAPHISEKYGKLSLSSSMVAQGEVYTHEEAPPACFLFLYAF
jgi:hypothetical protein